MTASRIILLFTAFSIIYVRVVSSQQTEPKSIRQLQNEFYSSYNFQSEEEFDALNPYKSPPLENSAVLTKHVLGWNPYWVGTAYNNYNYTLLSTVAYFSYEVDTATGGYTTIHFWKTTNLLPLAHSYGVKVVLTVTNFGSASNTALLGNPQKRNRLIDSLIALVQFRAADGVNIDFELVPYSQRQNLVIFMTDLTNRFHTQIPGSKVSIDLPAVDWNNSFNVPALNTVCDYLVMMGYDYHWSSGSTAGPVAPLQSGSVWGSYNVTNSINYYLNNGAATGKLLLGVPYYGYQWPTVSGSINSQTTGTGTAYVYSSMKTRANTYGRLWDVNSLTPWYRYQSGSWYQGWYDDSVSLGYKYDFVNSRPVAGIGIWALSYDGSNPELWNLIARKFSVIGISGNENELPSSFRLYQNYPNPFNPVTKIRFDIPTAPLNERGAGGFVSLKLFDALGREIAALINEKLQPGPYEVKWNAADYPGGVYFCRLTVGNFSETRKLVLIK